PPPPPPPHPVRPPPAPPRRPPPPCRAQRHPGPQPLDRGQIEPAHRAEAAAVLPRRPARPPAHPARRIGGRGGGRPVAEPDRAGDDHAGRHRLHRRAARLLPRPSGGAAQRDGRGADPLQARLRPAQPLRPPRPGPLHRAAAGQRRFGRSRRHRGAGKPALRLARRRRRDGRIGRAGRRLHPRRADRRGARHLRPAGSPLRRDGARARGADHRAGASRRGDRPSGDDSGQRARRVVPPGALRPHGGADRRRCRNAAAPSRPAAGPRRLHAGGRASAPHRRRGHARRPARGGWAGTGPRAAGRRARVGGAGRAGPHRRPRAGRTGG
ncbi:hypothetical protein FW320_32500, partial [Azospirillum sp. Vi22]|nr:hypothetical protein [Azospirillum baldaniorum]